MWRTSAFSRHDLPEVFMTLPLPRRGSRECRVRAAPAVSCASMCKETHTSIQVQRRQSGIPCAMVLRLMPCSPRRRILFVTVASGLRLVQARLGRRISAGLTSATDARTTRFCRTQQAPFVLRAVHRSRVLLALRSTLRADAIASTASPPAFVTTAKRPSCRERTGRAGRTDLPDSESEIFLLRGLDRSLLICPTTGPFCEARWRAAAC